MDLVYVHRKMSKPTVHDSVELEPHWTHDDWGIEIPLDDGEKLRRKEKRVLVSSLNSKLCWVVCLVQMTRMKVHRKVNLLKNRLNRCTSQNRLFMNVNPRLSLLTWLILWRSTFLPLIQKCQRTKREERIVIIKGNVDRLNNMELEHSQKVSISSVKLLIVAELIFNSSLKIELLKPAKWKHLNFFEIDTEDK